MVAADPPPHDHDGTCRHCPLCALVDGVGSVRPEVAVHLRAAGRELATALRLALDRMPAEDARREDDDGGLRRVDLDEPTEEPGPSGG